MTAAPPRVLAAGDAMLRRGPGAVVWTLGLPLALGLASHALINLVDLLLIGRLGEPAVRAAHVATTWNFLPMIVGNCVTTALLARLSRALGDDATAARRLHARAQRFLFVCGALVAVATALPAPWMVALTGLRGEVAATSVHYLFVSNLGCLPMFVLMQTTAAMRAAGEARVPLLLLLLANALNLVLDLVLMFGWEPLGVPAFGVVGAAYATVAGRTVAAGLALAWLHRAAHPLSLRDVPGPAAPPVAGRLLTDAWPQVVQIGLRAGIVLALTIAVQRRFGDAATAAIGITTRLDTLILFAALGFANAATAYAGRAVVSGRPRLARSAGSWAAAAAGTFGLLVLLPLQAWSADLVVLFLPSASAEVAGATADYLAIAGWGQVLGAAALGAIGAVHGSGRMVAPMLVDLVGFAVLFGWLAVAAFTATSLAGLFVPLVGGAAVILMLHVGFLFVRWPAASAL